MFSNICLSVNSLIHYHFLYCPPPPPRFLHSASPFSDQQLTQGPKCIHRPTCSTFHIQKVWPLKDGGSRGVCSAAAAELSLFPRHRQLSVYWTTALTQKVITLRCSGVHLCTVNPRVEMQSCCCLTLHSGPFQV